MYHELPEPECSACDAKNSETFNRRDCAGMRCLNCGHEKITEDRTASKRDQHCWTSNHTRPQF
jgi:hypothetical protein